MNFCILQSIQWKVPDSNQRSFHKIFSVTYYNITHRKININYLLKYCQNVENNGIEDILNGNYYYL